jgi:hypothetical protein
LGFGSFATFAQARDVAYTVAQAWAAKGAGGFTQVDVCTVRNAYVATEIAPAGTADQDCDGIVDVDDPDNDGDTIPDLQDNCSSLPNPSQSDVDGDGLGDVCDADADKDGIVNEFDNCPLVMNPTQADGNNDGIGDACSDIDKDKIIDVQDNCPSTPNSSQTDIDGDGLGDACDADDDGDGVADAFDNCPAVANPGQTDSDGGGMGDACDPDPNDPSNEYALTLDKESLTKIVVQIPPDPPDPTGLITLPVNLCTAGCEGGWLGDRRVHVQLTGLPDRSETWISQEDGRRVASPIDQGRSSAEFQWRGRGQGEYVIHVRRGSSEAFELGVTLQLLGLEQGVAPIRER